MESTQLQSACVSLGFQERSGYALEPDCLATVKLLIKFLRNEHDGHSVRYQLGYARIVQNDLIPILQFHSSNRELADAVLRLLLNLSQPTLVCFNGRIPTDKSTRKIFVELDQYLIGYKQAFANADFLKIITASLAKLVKGEHEGKLSEEDRLVLERYLLLIRNILHIDDARFKESGLAGEDLSGPSIHDELLLAMSRSGLDRILLYLATSAEEHGFALHVLEILWLLFRDITPAVLIAASKNDGSCALKLNAGDLNEIKRQSMGSLRASGPYRAELKGTFAVQNKWLGSGASTNPFEDKPSSASSMVIHKHKGSDDAASALGVLNASKKRAKKSSLRDIAIQDTLEKDRSSMIAIVRPAVRDFLASFAKRLLVDASGYNNLMAAADQIITHSPADSHDESFYLWAISFFMELARGLVTTDPNFPASRAVECIGQTLGIEALTFVHTHMTTYADGLETDRFDKVMWNKRLVLAMRAFGEQIAWADTLARCKDDPTSSELGRTLVFNIVYEPQFRDVLPQLLRRYKESRHCRAYLRSLVAATHAHLKLMDFLQQSGCDTVVVAQKSMKKPRKVANKKKERPNRTKAPWSDVVAGLREALAMANENDSDDGFMADDPIVRSAVEPALLAVDGDEVISNQSTVTRIGQLLLKHEPKYAVAALRLARKLFPEHADKYYGGAESSNLSATSDENFFEFLYETSEFLEDDELEAEESKENYAEDEDDENEEFDVARPVGREVQVNVTDLATKFCNVTTLQAYVMLFETWPDNSVETNHHVARFFKRVAVECQLPTMIYQLRVFAVCQGLLNKAEKAALAKNPMPAQELISFAKFAVNGFLKLAAKVGKTAFVEILFWKNRSDAFAFESNYENLQPQPNLADVDDIDAQIEAKQNAKKGKGKSKKNADAEPESAFDRLLKMQEGSVRKFTGDSDDDIDEEAWARLVDKKEPNVEEGESAAVKPKKKRTSRKPKSSKGGAGTEVSGSSKKKAKKRVGATLDQVKNGSFDGSPSNLSSAESGQIAQLNSAKRVKLGEKSDEEANQDNSDSDDEVLAVRRVGPQITISKFGSEEPKDDLESVSSLSSLELEIVDEIAENVKKTEKQVVADLDEDLFASARLQLSDSSDDEKPLTLKKSGASQNQENESDADSESNETSLKKKKAARRVVISDEEDE